MLASAIRVTDTEESNWNIVHESLKEGYEIEIKEIGEGKMSGFAKMIFTRVFYPDSYRDFEAGKGTANELLGLEKEDLDVTTREA
jgi:hypothetical protein